MEFAIVGWPGDGATLRLDYRTFAYAGKFAVGDPGKAVVRTGTGTSAAPEWEPERSLPETLDPDAFDDDVIAAVSFSPDRTDAARCRLRYVAVHVARRGEGIAPELIARLLPRLDEAGYDRVRIAVNNPFAYEALYKIGFAYTGDRTGLAELELARPADRPAPTHDDGDRYRAGLDRFMTRDPDRSAHEFLRSRLRAGPPRRPDDTSDGHL